MTDRRPRLAATLGWLTFTATAAGVLLYETGRVGWAQLSWVLASGLAGGFVVAIVDPPRR